MANYDIKNAYYPIRIIPFDLGYNVSDKYVSKLKEYCVEHTLTITCNVNLLGNQALLSIMFQPDIIGYIFSDGIGVIVFYDKPCSFKQPNQMKAEKILKERKDCHRMILSNEHIVNEHTNDFIFYARNLVQKKKRRFTSYEDWENRGLSYVMSFYVLTVSIACLKEEQFLNALYSLMYPDNYTYKEQAYQEIENERKQILKQNCDRIEGVHTCLSWANFVVFSDKDNIDFEYYVSMEIALQHIWMYSYITEQYLDHMLTKKKYFSKEFDRFYNSIMEMLTVVKKYNSVINSTTHERDYKLFEQLMISSKLPLMEDSINEKATFLKDKMEWMINNRRLRDDRNIEILVIILTLIQVVTSFGIEFGDLLTVERIFTIIGIVILLLIYRFRV